MPPYLSTSIAAVRRTQTPCYGRTVDGYSTRRGAPIGYMIQLDGCTRWRRVYVWQFSNAGTAFVRVDGTPHILRPEHEQAIQDA